ncbi:MAG: cyclic nucleotide-binding domain-containing protein, partial [Myxococcota bacterium]
SGGSRHRFGGRLMRSSSIERLLAFRAFPGFREVSPESLAPIARYTRDRVFKKGEVILEEGEPVRSMHFLLKGEVQVSRSGLPFRLIRVGQSFGALAALAGVNEGVRAEATCTTHTLELSIENMETVFLEHFDLLTATLRSLARAGLVERNRLAGGGYDSVPEVGVFPEGPMELIEKVVSLKETLIISQHRVDALVDLSQACEERRYQPGDTLWRVGDFSRSMTHIVAGLVDCETADGAQFRFGSGAFIGAMDAMSESGRWFGVKAVTEVVVLQFDAGDWVDILEDHSYMGLDLLRGIADDLFAVLGKRRSYANDDSPL